MRKKIENYNKSQQKQYSPQQKPTSTYLVLSPAATDTSSLTDSSSTGKSRPTFHHLLNQLPINPKRDKRNHINLFWVSFFSTRAALMHFLVLISSSKNKLIKGIVVQCYFIRNTFSCSGISPYSHPPCSIYSITLSTRLFGIIVIISLGMSVSFRKYDSFFLTFCFLLVAALQLFRRIKRVI